jgi:hypothetical protein
MVTGLARFVSLVGTKKRSTGGALRQRTAVIRQIPAK